MSERKGPDNLEKGLRFGCGGMFGALVGAYIGMELLEATSWLLPIAIGALICGILATVFGERFWNSL